MCVCVYVSKQFLSGMILQVSQSPCVVKVKFSAPMAVESWSSATRLMVQCRDAGLCKSDCMGMSMIIFGGFLKWGYPQ